MNIKEIFGVTLVLSCSFWSAASLASWCASTETDDCTKHGSSGNECVGYYHMHSGTPYACTWDSDKKECSTGDECTPYGSNSPNAGNRPRK